jgi:hypothetical protein
VKSESLYLAEINSKRKNYFAEVVEKDDDEVLSFVDQLHKDELNDHRFKGTAEETIASIDQIMNMIMWTTFSYSALATVITAGYAIYHNHFNSQSCDVIACIDGNIVATTLLLQLILPFFLAWSIPMSWRSTIICECLSDLCILANIFSAKEYENENLRSPKFIFGIIGIFALTFTMKRSFYKRHINMFRYSDGLFSASINETRKYLYDRHSLNRRREVFYYDD